MEPLNFVADFKYINMITESTMCMNAIITSPHCTDRMFQDIWLTELLHCNIGLL